MENHMEHINSVGDELSYITIIGAYYCGVYMVA
jgi:hypothetical protein